MNIPNRPFLYCFAILVIILSTSAQPVAAQKISLPQTSYDCSIQNQISIAECQALVDFYNSTGGKNWRYKTGWLLDTTPCGWYGVTCGTPENPGSQKFVRQISLQQNDLTGSFPLALVNLTRLEKLNFSFNRGMDGVIPEQIGNMTSLEYLDLSFIGLEGEIPPQMSNMVSLKLLDLSTDYLSGEIPPQFGNFPALEELYLANNSLTGAIPEELGNISTLKILNLSNNQLSGAIPAQLANLSSLQDLSLLQNKLTGNIPPELGDLSALQSLSLVSNQLTGGLPVEIGKLTSLSELDIAYNLLVGPIPSSLINLNHLERFYFKGTNLCEPDETAFQTWKNSVTTWYGTQICNFSNKIYLPGVIR